MFLPAVLAIINEPTLLGQEYQYLNPIPQPDLLGLYFESQVGANCAIHAVNNLFGGRFTNVEMFQDIAEKLWKEESALYEEGERPDVPNPYLSATGTGNYDVTTLEMVLASTGKLQAKYIHNNLEFEKIRRLIPGNDGLYGFLVNYDQHWFAIRYFRNEIFKLDSITGVQMFYHSIALALYLQEHLRQGHSFLTVSRKTLPTPPPTVQDYLSQMAGLTF